MSGEAHIIEIDSIVLMGADLRDPDRLSILIEAEVLRALSGSDSRTSPGIASSETRVAGEVARTVMQSIQGEAEGV